MPDGRLQRIDHAKNEAHIVRRGREFLASISEVESHARVPGARVHFDIDRDNGIDRAANVRLAVGTRTNRRQRRFGDLAGAKQPGAKVKTGASRLGVDVSTQPVRVVSTWIKAVASGDTDGALSLYSPDAVVHTESTTYSGRTHFRAFLDQHAPRRFDPDEVWTAGEDQLIRADWPAPIFGIDEQSDEITSCWFQIDHGHIIEQWHGVSPDHEVEEPEPNGVVDVVVDGPVPRRHVKLARERMEKLLQSIDQPVRLVRIKLSVIKHSTKRPVSASASIDVDGTVLRAQVSSREVPEAIDAVEVRLRRQLTELTHRRRNKTLSNERFSSWHHGDPPTDRPEFFERPLDERQLVRHKSYTTESATVDEALWDMHVLDYDFFLFTEMTSQQDCVLATTTAGVSLQAIESADDIPPSDLIDIVHAHGAQALTVTEAIARLSAGLERFLFFENVETERGNVLYLRYDGHYGLITPAV